MEVIDYVLVGVYLVAVCAVGVVTHIRSRKAVVGHEARGFFLAESAAPWWAVATSYFASNIGSDAIIGLSSAGATVGISASWFDFASALAFIILAYGFLPVYRRCGVFTLPEYMERRFSKGIRAYLAGIALVMYVLSKTAVTLFCGAIVIDVVAQINTYLAISLLLVLTAVITLIGGLHAVINIEVVNSVLLLISGVLAAAIAAHRVGGWAGMKDMIEAQSADAVRAGMSPEMVHLRQRTGPYALQALVLGSPIMILWFHCCDQEMVQRGLASASNADSKLGAVAGGYLKLTVPWTWCLPGLVIRLLMPEELGCTLGAIGEPCDNANNAYPLLMRHVLPVGVRGLMVAASLAGVFSVLASTFNSASTLFAMDFYHRFRAAATERELVWAGRGFVALMGVLAVFWLPLLAKLTPSLYTTMQSLNALFSPPILAVFVAALLWPGAAPAGAWVCLVTGHVMGGVRLILTLIPRSRWAMTESAALRLLVDSDYLYFAAASFAFSGVLLVLVSMFAANKRLEEVAPLTARGALEFWHAAQQRLARWLGRLPSAEWHRAKMASALHLTCDQCNARLPGSDAAHPAGSMLDSIVIDLPSEHSGREPAGGVGAVEKRDNGVFAIADESDEMEPDQEPHAEAPHRRLLRSETLSPIAEEEHSPTAKPPLYEEPADSSQSAEGYSVHARPHARSAGAAGVAGLAASHHLSPGAIGTRAQENTERIPLTSPPAYTEVAAGSPSGLHPSARSPNAGAAANLCEQCRGRAAEYARKERVAFVSAFALVAVTLGSMAAVW